MENRNQNLRKRLAEVEKIIKQKYPAALATLREYKRLHPDSTVRIPDIIAPDL